MKQFLVLLTALGLALVLAGCGGSSSGTKAPPVDPGPTPSDILAKVNAATASAATLQTAAATLTTLSGAHDAEGSARNTAKTNVAKIGTLAADGNSSAAQMSAQAVLDAEQGLQDAIDAVTAAETVANAAKAALAGLPAKDTAGAADAVDKALTAADTAKKAAKAVQDEADTVANSLAASVKLVSADKTDTTPAISPATIGKGVADAIQAALAPTASNDGTGVRITFNGNDDTVPTASTATATKPVSMNNATGMTWAEIVGADNLMDRLIADTGTSTKSVKVAAIAGMKVTDVFGTGATLDATTGVPANSDNDGAQTTSTETNATTNYMGIPGTVICGGDDCKAKDGNLTGSWYFTPTNATESYTKIGDAKTYSVDTLYAKYGHWLAVAENGEATVHTFAQSSGNGDNLDFSTAGAHTDSEATYTGNAAGRSVHRTYNEDGKQTDIQSGSFTANVSLTAEFGSSPMLRGTVNNFQSADNPGSVGSNWSVELVKRSIDGSGFTDGVAKGSGQNGDWTTLPFGLTPQGSDPVVNQRPSGFYGSFNAHFTDGHAAGGYAVRK